MHAPDNMLHASQSPELPALRSMTDPGLSTPGVGLDILISSTQQQKRKMHTHTHTLNPQSDENTFARQLAKLNREKLLRAGKDPTIQKKQICANCQAAQANLYLENDRALFVKAWAEMKR